ncbi:MAG: ATP synthase F1 subunit epsilon [Candidatus Levybacteria bacterium]|nr:ATP synthase F1 subunit epsilon [Candidatus Levybacteria bacterium]
MANSKFYFEIITPDGIIYQDNVDEVKLPTPTGEIAILPHHVPLYAKLGDGEATIIKDGKETLMAVLGGIVDISDNKVSIISDYAIQADSIQIAKAEEAKKRAEEAKLNKQETQDFIMEDKELRKSILELKVAQKIRRPHRPNQ